MRLWAGIQRTRRISLEEESTNLPLRALANGEDGDNGVFAYSTTSVFPANSFGAANYWVDLTFHAKVFVPRHLHKYAA